ncbi:MAG: hypothetical protein HY749_04365 [Gammaproteobacteria bacterium]|nr:hypothetical protein [Gammaproteobacteria bacterium]
MKIYDDALCEDPENPDVLRGRAHLFARLSEWPEAVKDIDRVILVVANEPDDYFSRARWRISLQDYVGAIADLTYLLELEKNAGDSYYSELAYFFRAEAHLRSRAFSMAISDARRVRPDVAMPIEGTYRSAIDIISDAEAKLRGKDSSRRSG